MAQQIFTSDDLRQIRSHGLSMREVQRHLHLFKMPPSYLMLLRPCTIGDGVKLIDKERMQALSQTYEFETQKRGCLKFVPASGAASRMFKTLLWFLNQEKEITRESIARDAQAGAKKAQELIIFMDGTEKFAFFEDLESVMSGRGLHVNALLRKGEFTEIARLLLSEQGLNYATLPKGLLKFHDYPDGSRTAFEEHLVEAASYVMNQNGRCSLHFTVSQEHLEKFRKHYERIRPIYERKLGVSFQVNFSIQKKSTDTLAVDLDNRPFRQSDGKLVFRPGGHGALIENLNDLKGDIVFIKNIDNIVPDRLKSVTFEWKKILGGYLINLQKQIFGYVDRLSSGLTDSTFLDQVIAFMKDELLLVLPASAAHAAPEKKRALLLDRLNRPIRVCGVVKNRGEAGGGPFWVQDQTGEISFQIVEKAQIDPNSNEQQAILASSTHFNPVDLVCGVSDWQERPFDLRQFVDPNAVFISYKSKEGKELKALEHPGLWNGAMARWITVFVEVPSITFNPVKTVNDLLRKEHQPG